MSEATDEILMLEVRDGQVGRLSVLFERHHKALFQFLYRLTSNRELSEDLVQDVFFRMLRYRETYRPRTSFAAWMYQVARNAMVDALRKRKNEMQWDEEADPVSREPSAHERLNRQQETELLRRALAALPEEKRELLVLCRYQNLRYEEIGRILGCDTGAVKVRVYRAVRALSQIFSEMAGEKIT